MITIGVIVGVLVMLALQAANAERLMRPEAFQDDTWGASLFSTSWATGALAAAAVIRTTGSPQESGIGSDLLTATALGAFTWGTRLLIRQGMQDRAKALEKLGRTKEQGTARERLALEFTNIEREARSALWRGHETLNELWETKKRLTIAILTAGNAAGIMTTVYWNILAGTAWQELHATAAAAVSISLGWYCDGATRTTPGFTEQRTALETEQLNEIERSKTETKDRCERCGLGAGDGVEIREWNDAAGTGHRTCNECSPTAKTASS